MGFIIFPLFGMVNVSPAFTGLYKARLEILQSFGSAVPEAFGVGAFFGFISIFGGFIRRHSLSILLSVRRMRKFVAEKEKSQVLLP
jgi:hypothetical protein